MTLEEQTLISPPNPFSALLCLALGPRRIRPGSLSLWLLFEDQPMKDPVDQRTGKGRLEYFFLVCSLPTRVHCGGGCDLYSFFVGNFFSHFWFLSGLEALLSYLAPADNQEFNTTASLGAFQHHRLGLYQ